LFGFIQLQLQIHFSCLVFCNYLNIEFFLKQYRFCCCVVYLKSSNSRKCSTHANFAFFFLLLCRSMCLPQQCFEATMKRRPLHRLFIGDIALPRPLLLLRLLLLPVVSRWESGRAQQQQCYMCLLSN